MLPSTVTATALSKCLLCLNSRNNPYPFLHIIIFTIIIAFVFRLLGSSNNCQIVALLWPCFSANYTESISSFDFSIELLSLVFDRITLLPVKFVIYIPASVKCGPSSVTDLTFFSLGMRRSNRRTRAGSSKALFCGSAVSSVRFQCFTLSLKHGLVRHCIHAHIHMNNHRQTNTSATHFQRNYSLLTCLATFFVKANNRFLHRLNCTFDANFCEIVHKLIVALFYCFEQFAISSL
jgi:hypothetical protein